MNEKHFLILLCFVSAIGGFLFGYDTGVISGALVLITQKFDLSNFWQEAIVASTVGMAGIFSLVGAVLTELIGRKPTILLASFTFSLGAFVMAAATSEVFILMGRLIVGVGLGLASMTCSMYIGEVAPAGIRGQLVIMNTAMLTGGQLIASIVDGIFSFDEDNGWRYMLGLSALPSTIQFIAFIFLPESPMWLIIHKPTPNYTENVLKKIRNERETREELKNLIDYKESYKTQPSSLDTLKKMLKTKTTRRALATGCMIQIFQQLSGINTFMYYSASILQSSGIGSTSTVIWLATIPAAANFVFTFVGMWMVERFGRRRLSMTSLLVAFCGLVFLSIGFHLMTLDDPAVSVHEYLGSNCTYSKTCDSCIKSTDCGFCFGKDGSTVVDGSCLPYTDDDDDFSYIGRCANSSSMDEYNVEWAPEYCPSKYAFLTVVAMCVYLAGFASGMGSLPWVVNSEIYPIWGRGIGSGLSTTCNWASNLVISFTFITLSEAMTQTYFFLMIGCFNLLAIVYIFLFLPETKGVPLDKVEQLFDGPTCFVGLKRNRPTASSTNLLNEQTNE